MGPYMLNLARPLFALGYRFVPIEPGSKSPPLNDFLMIGWPRFGHRLTLEQVEGFIRRYPDHGIGLLTAWTPAVDIDVRTALAEDLEDLAVEHFGPALVRVGEAPKRALLYRTDEPFRKITSAKFVMPDDDVEAPGYKPHGVEVLGNG